MKPIICIVVLGLVVGCHSHLPASSPTTNPIANNAGLQRFADPNAGIAFMYPSGWKPVGGSKSQLKVTAPDGGQLTLDVPVLPWHIPGMIPVDQVTSGYVADYKKRVPDAAVTPLPDPALPAARQQRVKLTGHQNGKVSIDEAVLIVHNDKLYILAIDSDDHGYPQMHGVLDGILKSLQWTK